MTEQETIQALRDQVKEMEAMQKSLYYAFCTLHLFSKCKNHRDVPCTETCSFKTTKAYVFGELAEQLPFTQTQPNPEAVYPKGRYHGD
jgi:hypothetical protein